jgi:hypothetical protein
MQSCSNKDVNDFINLFTYFCSYLITRIIKKYNISNKQIKIKINHFHLNIYEGKHK